MIRKLLNLIGDCLFSLVGNGWIDRYLKGSRVIYLNW